MHTHVIINELDLIFLLLIIQGTKVIDSKRPAAPAFSFGQRPKSKADTYGPGPANYNIAGMSEKGNL